MSQISTCVLCLEGGAKPVSEAPNSGSPAMKKIALWGYTNIFEPCLVELDLLPVAAAASELMTSIPVAGIHNKQKSTDGLEGQPLIFWVPLPTFNY